ncbi:entericidin, EcnA/B family [Moraxella catarrhalis]|mgnify:FL=1|uniref:Bacteriolytic lipoprotein entericidin B n=1 Tax=Moraxella catarrhalis TaxID=480 RepID=A0A198UE03_MORCA|nr:entericidin A/B family lipoprotein [Moraxella catarrhalis]MPW74588.1 entericidin, EcnA/B family [Moraxella catarrhalis]MPX29392.1 entericidin, EcnA/B family [Moraxella catarrhalis]MPY07356.1 entericidin A/B family lipoprotein [Moraxella catarrhalis]OAU94614.1 bacteriolytic lipoprotein entericidin B [Moraxella catarrhalis]OAU98713.1 bacteriolytic lipoprotein entericidin B [Moraxella catarrhalis]
MKKVLIASIAAVVVLTGCNTIKGFGKDVSKTGEAVSDTAQKVEKKI